MTEFLVSFAILAAGMFVGAGIAFAVLVIALRGIGPKF